VFDFFLLEGSLLVRSVSGTDDRLKQTQLDMLQEKKCELNEVLCFDPIVGSQAHGYNLDHILKQRAKPENVFPRVHEMREISKGMKTSVIIR
jgi:hypothetical protein